MALTSLLYDSESPSLFLKSLETTYNDNQVFEEKKIANETNKNITDMLSKIISQNEEIKQKLEKMLTFNISG
jgi:hypothetical protein